MNWMLMGLVTVGVAVVAAGLAAMSGRCGGRGLGLTRKERLALSNRMQQRWADALLERRWRQRVWMREQESLRNIHFDGIRDRYLRQQPSRQGVEPGWA